MIISIDFDGTIVNEIYPDIGQLKPNAKEVINKLHNEGHTIIINTCRVGTYQDNAEEFLFNNDIWYDWINTNCPTRVQQHNGQDSRKISADIYIDDKNLGGIPDWLTIYDMIQVIWNKKQA